MSKQNGLGRRDRALRQGTNNSHTLIVAIINLLSYIILANCGTQVNFDKLIKIMRVVNARNS